jgi:hypothetical protein
MRCDKVPMGWIATAVTVCTVFGGWAWYVRPLSSNLSPGEKAGAFESLFSGLALVGVIVAIWLQGKELALQRTELKLTRRELKRSAASQEKSERALGTQAQALLLAARLNAVNAIAQTYAAQIQQRRGSQEIGSRGLDAATMQLSIYRQKLERLLFELQFMVKSTSNHNVPAVIKKELPPYVDRLLHEISAESYPDLETGADPNPTAVINLLRAAHTRISGFRDNNQNGDYVLSLMLEDALQRIRTLVESGFSCDEYDRENWNDLTPITTSLSHINQYVED